MTEIVTADKLPEYDAFVASHPKGHFMQSSLWAKQKTDWTWRAIIRRDAAGQITGSLALLARRPPMLPFALVYGCRGPVCDPHDRDTLMELLSAARAWARSKRAYVLKLDPDIPCEDTAFIALMKRAGFSRAKNGPNFEGIQPRFVFRLNIQDMTEDEVLAQFHSKTRYNLRVAERKGVEVKLCGPEALPDFARLMLVTGVRDGFVTRPESYFASMLRNLGEHARLYMAYAQGVPIGGALAVHYGDKVWYLYGASANEYRNYMPNYLLQWHMIRWAVSLGCRIYDFRGVSGDVSEDNPLYGLYRFKKGFGGDFVEFAGEFDFVPSRALYNLVCRGERVVRRARAVRFLRKHRGEAPAATEE